MLRDVKPTLAIIDSLGSYSPETEEKNSAATRTLKQFRSIARECGTATIFVHHRRKLPRKAEESAGPLETANLRKWFQDSRGASSLINGSDIRLGVDQPNMSAVGKDDVALVLRGFGRVRGEIGPLFLARVLDENGDPLGYRHLTGPELLCNEQQKNTLLSLPESFTFKEAKHAYGKADQATSDFLRRCIEQHLVRRPKRGHYEKVMPSSAEADGERGGKR